jgi:PIN domain nuclease of toxin-antitoxin system
MNALLDTHVWIWLLEDPSKIAPPVLQQLEAADTLVLSVASMWEIAIKVELGKLAMKASPEAVRHEILHEMQASELAIQTMHAISAARLPKVHKDPFDRMLVAQAQVERLVLVTADDSIRQYGGAVLWAG